MKFSSTQVTRMLKLVGAQMRKARECMWYERSAFSEGRTTITKFNGESFSERIASRAEADLKELEILQRELKEYREEIRANRGHSLEDMKRVADSRAGCFAIISGNTGNISSGNYNAPRRFFKTFKEAERAAEELVEGSTQWHKHGLFIVQIVGKTTAVKVQTTRVIDEECCPDDEED